MANTILHKRNSSQGSAPATGSLSLGELSINTFDGKLFLKRNNGSDAIVQINRCVATYGSAWQSVAGLAPEQTFEFDDLALLFKQSLGQAVIMFIRIPTDYLTGTDINLKGAFYSPGSSNNIKMQLVSTLIRKNTDAVTSTTNQNTSTNSDVLLTLANKYNEIVFNITSSNGLINGVAVSPGDIVKLQLSRVSTAGTEDTNDVRFLPATTEILFS